MSNKNIPYVLVTLLTITAATRADDILPNIESGYFDILDLGCHNADGECFVTIPYIAGTPMDNLPSECTGIVGNVRQLRWNITATANGRVVLALLMSTQVANKKVDFGIQAQTDPVPCYTRPGDTTNKFATFDWVHVLSGEPLHGVPVY
jgi:hypothetical protein